MVVAAGTGVSDLSDVVLAKEKKGHMCPDLRRWALLIGVSCTVATASACGSVGRAGAPPTAAELDSYLRDMVGHDDFSGSVVVTSGGRILLARGYGFADRDKRILNTSSTRFRLSSLVRQLNVVALLRLQEQKKLRISDPACRYLEPCPPGARGVTIRQLMESDWGRAPTDTLLAQLASRVAGGRWLRYIRQNLLPDAVMERSGVQEAKPYVLDASGSFAPPRNTSRLAAVETIMTSASDLARFLSAISDGGLLTAASRRFFFPGPGVEGWNCCWYATRTPYGRALFHGAHGPAADGWYALVSRRPANRLTIVILANSDSAPIAEIEDDLARIVLGRPHLVLPPTPRETRSSLSALERFVGDYTGSGFRPLTVRRSGRRLIVSPSWLAVSGSGGEPLVAVGPNEFVFVRRPDVRITFDTSASISRLLLRFTGFRRNPSWRAVYTLRRQD